MIGKNNLYILIGILIFFITAFCYSNEKKNVLILHSYHLDMTWTDGIMEGINSVLGTSQFELELHTEYMDTKYYNPEKVSSLLVDLYILKYKEIDFDVIISSDNNALDFLLSHRGSLFPETPIVFCGINNFHEDMLSGEKNITGVAEDFDFKSTLDLSLHLHRDTEYVAIVSDNTPTSLLTLERIQNEFSYYHDSVTFIELTDLSTADLKTALNTLPPATIVIQNGLYRDRDGELFETNEGLDFVVGNSSVPVYTLWDTLVTEGVLGGVVVYAQSQGIVAASIALRILNGESADTVPVILKSPNVPVFDYNAMVRFNVNEKDLPDGSVILHKPISFYYQHKTIVWITGVFIIILSATVAALLISMIHRKRIEDKMQHNERWYETIFEESPISLWEEDFSGVKKQLDSLRELGVEDFEEYFQDHPEAVRECASLVRVLRVNKETLTSFEAKNRNNLLSNLLAVFPEDIEDGFKEELLSFSRGNMNYEADVLNKTLTGKEKIFALKSTLISGYEDTWGRVMISLMDITERKGAEDALRSSRDLMQTVIDGNPDDIMLVDRNYRILLANQVVKNKLAGKNLVISESLCYKLSHNLDKPCSEENGPCPFESVIEKKVPVMFTQSHWDQNGKVSYVDVSAAPIFNKDGEVIQIIKSSRNVTERVNAEEDRKRLIIELEARNTELEQFVYTVSHDLKSPLITIRGYLGFLEKAGREGDLTQMNTDINRIMNASEKMYNLLNDLLDFSRIGRMMNSLEEIPFEDLVEEALELVKGNIGEEEIDIKVAGDFPLVWGDRQRLLEVLINLIENAVKYMGNRDHPVIEIGFRINDGESCFYVLDNGMGIKSEYHQRVFRLFEKLDQETEGVGVGLAIVKRIIEAHGCRIWAESEGLKKGSRFCFTLPQNGDT